MHCIISHLILVVVYTKMEYTNIQMLVTEYAHCIPSWMCNKYAAFRRISLIKMLTWKFFQKVLYSISFLQIQIDFHVYAFGWKLPIRGQHFNSLGVKMGLML